jgi:thiol:disulfide interchange protein DsbD
VLASSINQRLSVVQHRSRQTRPALSLPILSFIARIFALAALLAGWPAIAGASPPAAELVQAELIAEPAAIKAGEPFWVGVRLRIKDHWHVYWRNPGDSGEAPTIVWQLSPGFAAGPIAWPTP